ncbi:MAG: PEP-CTERM sorting domain-containing protein [Akkermansiaceae bacterium]
MKNTIKNTLKLTAATAAVASVCMTTQVSAVTIAFDVGTAGGLDVDTGLSQTTHSGVVWNNFGAIAGAVDHGGVQDTLGNETSFTLLAAGVGGRDGNGTLNAGWGGSVPQATVDSWYFRGSGTMTLVLKGATPGSLWDINVVNAFNTAANESDMQVNGLFADGTAGPSASSAGDDWDRKADGWDNNAGLIFSGVAADVSGEFHITFDGGNPTLQALEFTSVPEPSSTALLGLGGLALIMRRRK